MRRVFKVLGLIVLGLIVIAGGFAAYVAITGIPKYKPGNVNLKAASTPEKVERGRKYVSLLCVGCHLDPATGKMTGRRLADVPTQFGAAYSRNITQDPKFGIGGWSDGEIAYLLRTGVARDGRYTPPWMPKYPHMADDDLESVIAFLRSNDPIVAAAAVNPPGVSKPSFLAKLLTHVVFKPLPYPKLRIELPSESDRSAYGRYLAINVGCFACHSADFKKLNDMEPEKSAGYMGGGNALRDVSGKEVRSANLTADETGIGKWSEQDFVRAVRTGVRPDHTVFGYPMTPMPELTESDVAAIYAYLQTVPRIHNRVERPKREVAGAAASDGKALYSKYGCIACHGETGLGLADLRHATEHYPTDPQLEAFLRHAPSFKPNTKMPAFEGVIRDEDYAPLMQYVRELGRVQQSSK